jgi:hypothetical protein
MLKEADADSKTQFLFFITTLVTPLAQKYLVARNIETEKAVTSISLFSNQNSKTSLHQAMVCVSPDDKHWSKERVLYRRRFRSVKTKP